jgi:hypothetical protein
MSRQHVQSTSGLLDHIAYQQWLNEEQAGSHLDTIVRETVEKTRGSDRDLLLARFYERLSYRQIAARFNLGHPYSAHWAVARALTRFTVRFERALRRAQQEQENR